MKPISTLLAPFFVAIVSTVVADEAGFANLFNGKDLSGWKGDQEFWSIQDGAITAKTTAD